MKSFLNHAALALLQAAALIGAGCRTSSAGDGALAAVDAKAAVFAKTSTAYLRARNPDGSFQRETCEVKNGGSFGGARSDETMDKLDFGELSPSIVRHLAAQHYVAVDDPPAAADLLILVYCGITVVPPDAAPPDRDPATLPNWPSSYGGIDPAYDEAAARYRPMKAIDTRNAEILGFTDALVRPSPNSPGRDALMAELEQNRYYLALLAFDSRASGEAAQRKLVWQVRVSVPAAQNSIEKAFPKMVRIASHYFGQDSRGLVSCTLDEAETADGEPDPSEPAAHR